MKSAQLLRSITLSGFLLAASATFTSTLAAEKSKASEAPAAETTDAAADTESEADSSEIEKIKKRYWAQGNEKEMSVVQNKIYTKEGRFEFTLHGGFLTTDPFLNVMTAGASLGYHFDETFSLHAFGWKNMTSPSAALVTLEAGGKKANTNRPYATAGIEGRASLLYGKLSLMGRKILYYDMHAGLGGATIRTENGTYLAPLFSIGQNIFLSRWLTFRVDYRLLAFREDIIEREVTALLGQNRGQRTNFSNSITFGISLMFGGPSK